MKLETYRFQNEIKKYIKEIWTIEFSADEKSNLKDVVIPTGFIDIVFNYGDDYFQISDRKKTMLPRILITGLFDHAVKLEYGQQTKLLGMVLSPIGFLSIFHLPIALYKNSIIDGNSSKWNLSPLYELLSERKGIDEMAICIDEYFNDVDSEEYDRLDRILKEIERSNGETKITDLALQLHLSESAFVRYFKKNTGITPKAYTNIVRFKHFLSKDSKDPCDSYYDQSHLIKHCKRYTGKTPKELLKNSNEITFQYILNNADFLQYFDGEEQ